MIRTYVELLTPILPMSRQYITAAKCINAVDRGVTFKSYCSTIKIGKTDYAIAGSVTTSTCTLYVPVPVVPVSKVVFVVYLCTYGVYYTYNGTVP